MLLLLLLLQEFHTKGDYLGPRTWSPLAMWRMREFNELPHVFQRRVNASIKPANQYERQFPVPVLTVVAKYVVTPRALLCVLLLPPY